MKIITRAISAFFIGLLTGILVTSSVLFPEKTKLILEIIQSLTITLVSIFTAWWTSKTFGYPQKTEEAKELRKLLSSLSNSVNYYITHHRLLELNKLTKEVIPSNNLDYENFLIEEETRLRQNFDMCIFELKRAYESFITLEPWTSYLLLDLTLQKIDSIKSDSGEKIRKDIMALQFRLRDEASFNIKIEWIKFKKFFGF